MRRLLPTILALAPLALACGEDTVNPTYTDISAKIFTPSCATSACHSERNKSADGPGAGLLLDAATGYANLQGRKVESTTWPDAYKDYKLVEPGNPEKSALYLTLVPPAGLPKDLEMPDGSTLSATKIEAIRQWIADGAKNN